MKLLFHYIKQHKPLLALALVLAAINQSFALCDSIITGQLINRFGAPHNETNSNYFWYPGADFTAFAKMVSLFLLLSIGAALLSRIAKNFQDYFTNIIIQRTGAQMYSDGIKKALSLPYTKILKTSAAEKPWANCKK